MTPGPASHGRSEPLVQIPTRSSLVTWASPTTRLSRVGPLRLIAAAVVAITVGSVLAGIPGLTDPAVSAELEIGRYNRVVQDTGGNTVNRQGGSSISGDGRFLTYSRLGESDLRVVNVTTGREVTIHDAGGSATVFDAALSRDASVIVSTNRDPAYGHDTSGGDDVVWEHVRSGTVWPPSGGWTDVPLFGAAADSSLGVVGGVSRSPSITSGGRTVAFSSTSDQILDDDPMLPPEDEDGNDVEDVFVFDRHTDTLERISVDPNGDPLDDPSDVPTISGSGEFVVWRSASPDVIGGDSNGISDLFRTNLHSGDTELVTLNELGSQLEFDGDPEDFVLGRPSISDDGRYVAFITNATNIGISEEEPDQDRNIVYVRDMEYENNFAASPGFIYEVSGDDGETSYHSPVFSGDGHTIYAATQGTPSELRAWSWTGDPAFYGGEAASPLIVGTIPLETGDGWSANFRLATSDTGVVTTFVSDDALIANTIRGGVYALAAGTSNGHPDGLFVEDPVDVATGAFTDSWSDLAVPDHAWGLEWQRHYSSNDLTGTSMLGPGWSTSYSQTVTEGVDAAVTVTDEHGVAWTFTSDGMDGWHRPADFNADLSVNDNGTAMDPEDDYYEVTFFDGTVWSFDADGHLAALTSWDGSRTVEITRSGAELEAVTSQPSGFSLVFDSEDGSLANVTLYAPDDPTPTATGRTVDYSYQDGHLISVTDAVDSQWDITVDDYGRITELYQPLEIGVDPEERRLVVANTYGARGRVVAQEMGSGATVTYSYNDELGQTTVTSTVPGEGTEQFTARWDAIGRFTGAIDAAANSASRVYDDLGHLTNATSRRLDDDDEPYTLTQEPTANGRHIESRVDFDGALTEYAWDGDLLEGVTVTVSGEDHSTGYVYEPGDRIPSQIVHPTSTTEDPVVTDMEVVDGQVTEVTDPDGVVTAYEYDEDTGALVSVTVDPGGQDLQTTYGYDTDTGEQITVTSPEGRVTTTTYDALGRVLTQAGPGEAPTVYEYFPDGNLRHVTDPTGARVSYEYDETTGEVHTETVPYDPGAVSYDPDPESDSPPRTVNEYDAGQLVSVTRPGGAVTEYEYSILGRLARIVEDPAGASLVTEHGYDADGNLESVTQVDATPGDGDETLRTSFTEYDALGRPLRVYDALDRLVEETAYDERGNVTVSVSAPGTADAVRSEFDYDAEGRLTVTRRGPDGESLDVVEERAYTAAGRLHRVVSDPDGLSLVVEYGYDDAGRQVTSTVDPDGEALTTTTRYDDEGRVEEVESPEGRITTHEHADAMGGQVHTVTRPGVTPTVSVFNARGELVLVDGPDGEIGFGYDSAGNLVSVTDALGETVTYGYDDHGNRTSRVSHLGTESWDYNEADQLVAYHDPHDALDANRPPATYIYDDLGRLARTVDDTGRWETVTYDTLGRVGLVEFSDGDTTPDQAVSYGYDVAGQMTSMTDTAGTTVYGYDPHGHLVSHDGPDGEITAAWSPAGLRLEVAHDGDTTTYGYDSIGRLATVTDPVLDVTTYDYDDDGVLVYEDLLGDQFRSWTPDPDTGQIVEYQQHAAGDVRSTTLTWDETGRLESETTGATTRTYGYDAAGQLTSETVGDPGTGDDTLYAYDEAGRRQAMIQGDTTTTYQWSLDEATPATLTLQIDEKEEATTHTYDQTGRLITIDGPDDTVDIDYDTRGLPTDIETTTADGVYLEERAYAGDGTLRTVEITDPSTSSLPIDLLWDHTNPGVAQILASTAAGAYTTRAVYGHGRIGAETITGDAQVLAADHLGSTIRTTETANLAVASRYDPYGNPRGPRNPSHIPAFGYRGELTTSHGVHLRARDYQPHTGLFTTTDPLDGINGTTTITHPHHYTNNNPLNLTDPTGMIVTEGSHRVCATLFIAETAFFARDAGDAVNDLQTSLTSPGMCGPRLRMLHQCQASGGMAWHWGSSRPYRTRACGNWVPDCSTARFAPLCRHGAGINRLSWYALGTAAILGGVAAANPVIAGCGVGIVGNLALSSGGSAADINALGSGGCLAGGGAASGNILYACAGGLIGTGYISQGYTPDIGAGLVGCVAGGGGAAVGTKTVPFPGGSSIPPPRPIPLLMVTAQYEAVVQCALGGSQAALTSSDFHGAWNALVGCAGGAFLSTIDVT